jgi:hypothetical protein
VLSETFTGKYGREFRLKYTWMQNLILRYNQLYNSDEVHPDVEGILVGHITDLKCLLLTIIEELPRNLIIDLKVFLARANLIVTPEDGTPLRKIRRFIGKFAKDQDPDRNNWELEFLVQKNIMFIDLGFHYVSDSLLSQFVI